MKLKLLIFAMLVAAMGPAREAPPPRLEAQPTSPEEVATPQPEPARPELRILAASDAEPADFLWQARPVVGFADTPNDPAFREQMRVLEAGDTALIEREHVGGTCINEGCTPTKTMVASAKTAYVDRRSADYGVHNGPVSVEMPEVRGRKRAMVDSFRNSGQRRIEATDGLDLIFGEASFTGPRTLVVRTNDGEALELVAIGDTRFVNGASDGSPRTDAYTFLRTMGIVSGSPTTSAATAADASSRKAATSRKRWSQPSGDSARLTVTEASRSMRWRSAATWPSARSITWM